VGRFPYRTKHKIGHRNVQVLGLDVHNPVFFVSALLIVVFVLGTLLAPEKAQHGLEGARDWTLTHAHWVFSSTILIVFAFCIAVAVSPLGRLRLGGVAATPVFWRRSWLAMLFSVCVVLVLMF